MIQPKASHQERCYRWNMWQATKLFQLLLGIFHSAIFLKGTMTWEGCKFQPVTKKCFWEIKYQNSMRCMPLTHSHPQKHLCMYVFEKYMEIENKDTDPEEYFRKKAQHGRQQIFHYHLDTNGHSGGR